MAWKECTSMSERRELVRFASQEGANVSRLSQGFGISRKTAYKWLSRSRAGEESFRELSRRPRRSPRRTPPEIEALVCNLRRAHPWGGRKIRSRLLADGHEGVPAASSISAILRRNGLMQRSLRPQRDYLRFEEDAPNRLWQMDFKGDFLTGKGRCYPLTVLDDHSRFSIKLSACPNQRTETVRQQLTHAFQVYGLPDRMLMDNGAPWRGAAADFTHLTAWLIRLGVKISHGRPYHPQTQGKDERFHRTLKYEVLSHRSSWPDLEDVQRAFDAWRDVYNLYRPHEALADRPPVTRYRPSERRFPAVLLPIEYPSTDTVRSVSHKGAIRFGGRSIFISEGLSGNPVALRAVGDGIWGVYFCQQQVATIDLSSPPSEV